MTDPRLTKLARILVNHSVKVQKNHKVLISANQAALPLAQEVFKLCVLKQAQPHLLYSVGGLDYFYFQNATTSMLTKSPEISLFLANWADKFIRLYSSHNNRELASIAPKKLMLTSKAAEPVKKVMLAKPWVLTEFPSQSMAQSAGMSLDELEEIYFKACLQDWPKVGQTLKNLKAKLDNAKVVRVTGYQTDLTLSFTGRLFAAAAGECNMPDGEVFGAPLDNSVEGQVYFDLPSLRSGNIVEGVTLVFRQGKIVKATATRGQKYLEASLNTDPGARRLGEFAIGANYGIKKPMLNTLFDEKIGGTIHMAMGSAYPDKLGGGTNQSAIHWDLVKSMTQAGSEVTADGKTILKNGKLLPK